MTEPNRAAEGATFAPMPATPSMIDALLNKKDYAAVAKYALRDRKEREDRKLAVMDPDERRDYKKEQTVRRQHERANKGYYDRRQPVGSSGHRSAQGIRSWISDNGLSVSGPLSLEPDLQPEAPQRPEQIATAPQGYCRYCNKALPRGARADSKFCSDAHRKAYARRADQIDKADQAFKDYEQSERAKADAAAILAFHKSARDEMKDSAIRCGITAAFIETGDKVVAIHDGPLPHLRALLYGRRDTDTEILRLTHKTVETKVTKGNLTSNHPDVVALIEQAGVSTDGPERSVTLYEFDTAMLDPDPDRVGIPGLELRFKGDPGTGDFDEYDPPEEPPPTLRQIVQRQIEKEVWDSEIRAALKGRKPLVRADQGYPADISRVFRWGHFAKPL